MPESKDSLRVAILWHMHQPNYEDPGANRLVMPWVRLHALKDYLDMPMLSAEYESIKTTFNLVPSLLDQIDLYLNGGTDPHLELSRIPAEQLTSDQKTDILKTFFSANPPRMVEPYERYNRLYHKVQSNYHDRVLPALFTSEEMRDIQVWSNLTWVDPLFRGEEPIKSLFAKGQHYTEDEKSTLLDWQLDLMRRIVPTYQKLFQDDRIDISFTPYYHPILPLLCDTNSALEACPGMALPQHRFQHPEDAARQIAMSGELFEELFGQPMTGMWPSEGSVSEDVAKLMLEQGVKWIATDEDILFQSLAKAGQGGAARFLHTVYDYGPGLKMFFRDRALSDRIGFVYSNWDADRAVADLIGNLKRIRSLLVGKLDESVVPVILDGENAWEYFANDGEEFLRLFYESLERDPELSTVTMSEAAESVKPRKLKALFAGSWINHNFRIWIGHAEDNAAWDLLTQTRKTLVRYQKEFPNADAKLLEKAWRQIYIAEGSDWCWWYGDEHRGAHNEDFDRVFRRHLMAVYEILQLDVPVELLNPIYRSTERFHALLPEGLVTPTLDGRVSHFYEWSGAGVYECAKAGGAMHRGDRLTESVHFAFDHDWFYIRLDFTAREALDSLKQPVFQVIMSTPESVTIEMPLSSLAAADDKTNGYRVILGEVLEAAVRRTAIWPEGHGSLDFSVALFDGDQRLEQWPDNDLIHLDVPEQDKELFWPQ